MKRYVALMLLLTLCAGIALAGGQAEVGEETIQLRFQEHSNESRNVHIKRALAMFEDQNPNIDVTFEEVPWGNIREKVLTQAAGGDLPDVTYLAQLMVPSVAAEGILTPLDDLIERDAAEVNIDDFNPAGLAPFRIDGQLYALTSDFAGSALLAYNKQILDEAGVGVPSPDWDMDDFIEILQAVSRDTDGDGENDIWGLAENPTADLRFVDNFLKRNNESIFVRDAQNNVTGVAIDSPGAISIIQQLADLHHEYDVAPAAIGQQVPRFQIGRAAFTVTVGATVLGEYRETLDFPWGMTVLPAGFGDNPTASFIYCAGYAMPVGREHEDAAWDLLKWMTSADGMRVAVIESGFSLPPRRSLEDEFFELNADVEGVENIALSLGQVSEDVLHPGAINPYFPQVNSILVRALEAVALGDKTAEAAINESMPQIQAVFD